LERERDVPRDCLACAAVPSRIRHLPGIRSRSNVEIGVCSAFLLNLLVSVVLAVTETHLFRKAPSALLESLAGVGGAVFIAYTVGMTDLSRGMRRDPETETFLGVLVGLGVCGVAGICFALLLLEVAKPLGWLGHLAVFWSGVSVFFLACMVAALPLFAYERSRAKHLNQDD
jgi:peptidoglycan biosynthesis protein MviN/MurJ (putative lipid II flippase)